MARRYQKIQMLLPQIQQMLEDGMTQREVAEALGLEGDRPVHALLKRERKKAVQCVPKHEGGNLQRRCRNTSMRTNG